MLAALLASLFAPLVFLGNAPLALLGMILWGIGMGEQESMMKAAVARMVPATQRGAAFGLLTLVMALPGLSAVPSWDCCTIAQSWRWSFFQSWFN